MYRFAKVGIGRHLLELLVVKSVEVGRCTLFAQYVTLFGVQCHSPKVGPFLQIVQTGEVCMQGSVLILRLNLPLEQAVILRLNLPVEQAVILSFNLPVEQEVILRLTLPVEQAVIGRNLHLLFS